MRKRRKGMLPPPKRIEGHDRFNELRPLVNLENMLSGSVGWNINRIAHAVGNGLRIFAFVKHGNGYISTGMKTCEDKGNTTSSLSTRKTKYEW
jgi:hypothetical protein